MPTYTSALLPNTSGLTLGAPALRWTAYLHNVDIDGTVTVSGVPTTLGPSGSTGTLQYNNSGVFGGITGFVADVTNPAIIGKGSIWLGYTLPNYNPNNVSLGNGNWPGLTIHANSNSLGELIQCWNTNDNPVFTVTIPGGGFDYGLPGGSTFHNSIVVGGNGYTRPASSTSDSATLWADGHVLGTDDQLQIYNKDSTDSGSWKNVLLSNRAANVSSLLVASTGTTIKQMRLFTSVAVDPGSISATSRGSIAVTVAGTPGIATGDVIIPVQGVTNINDDLIFEGVTATGANQVTFFFYNPTVGAIDDTSHNWDILWMDVT